MVEDESERVSVSGIELVMDSLDEKDRVVVVLTDSEKDIVEVPSVMEHLGKAVHLSSRFGTLVLRNATAITIFMGRLFIVFLQVTCLARGNLKFVPGRIVNRDDRNFFIFVVLELRKMLSLIPNALPRYHANMSIINGTATLVKWFSLTQDEL